MTIRDALDRFGATAAGALTAEERAQLDRDGFVVLPGVLGPAQVDALNARLAALLAEEGEDAGKEVHQEAGTDRLSDLVNKGEEFRACFTHARVLAAVAHVLGADLKLSSLNARIAKPGEGGQHLHADWHGPVEPGDWRVCNSVWLLDDFTPDNGATRVVPGSHLRRATPQQEMADPSAPHPNEVTLTAPAGAVVVFNSHLWHGGTLNRTDRPRRAAFAYFCRRGEAQQLDQRAHLRPETAARLSEAERVLLDV